MSVKVCGKRKERDETPSPLAQEVAAVLRAPHKMPRTEGRRVRFEDDEELTVPKPEPDSCPSGSTTADKASSENKVAPEQKRQVKKQLVFTASREDKCNKCGIVLPEPYNWRPSQYTQAEMDHFAECEKIDLVPANQQLAEWAEPLRNPAPFENECVSCGNRHSSTVHDLRVVQRQQEPFTHHGDRVPLQPCPPSCASTDQLRVAVAQAVKYREGLDRCFCPIHRLLDWRLAEASGSPHAKWLGSIVLNTGLECGCQRQLTRFWCGICKHYQRQQVVWFYEQKHAPGGKLSWHQWLYVRECPREHVPMGYRD